MLQSHLEAKLLIKGQLQRSNNKYVTEVSLKIRASDL
jgi:hypothetical protein